MLNRAPQAGFSMLEILISIVVIIFGLLAIVALQGNLTKSQYESYQRIQASALADDMISRISANRDAVQCYQTAAGSFVGAGASAGVVNCAATSPLTSNAVTADEIQRAQSDMDTWTAQLQGASITESGSQVVPIGGARGCITVQSASMTVLVQVAWQGMSDGATPSAGLSCASGQYGGAAKRRVIARQLRIADLNPPSY